MTEIEKFLKNTYPFDRLPEEELKNISSSIELKNYEKGMIIFVEGGSPLQFLYIVLGGEVFLEKDSHLVFHLKKGDIFGYVSILGEMPPASTARVVEENTEIIQMPKQIFLHLISKYEEFGKFFTKELAKRVYKGPKIKSSFQVERLLDIRIKDLKIKEPLLIRGDANITETAKLMIKNDSTFCLVGKDSEVGIITERDIIKKVLAKEINPSQIKAQDIATFPVVEMDASEPLFNALLTMAKHGIRKLVIKDSGAILGILDDRTIISHEGRNIIFLIKEINKARNVEELAYLYSIVKDNIVEGVLSGLDPEYIGKYIAEINDHFMARVAQLTEEILGKPPVPYSIMVIGSEGRREQSLKTDQDNALIFFNNSEVHEFFEKFSQIYIDLLINIGFPPCPGNVMINNPYWRRSKDEWFKEINKWMDNPKPENILNVSIFFDFRDVTGSKELVEELWEFIIKGIKIKRSFLLFLASEAIKFKPPIGLLGKLRVEKTGEHKGEIDIKKYGIFPITQGIRVLSLHNEIRVTNTFERIRKLRDKAVFTDEFARDLEECYRFLMSLRLKSQAKEIRKGDIPDNFINPKELSKTEKDILKEVFRKIEKFQKLLFDKYNLRYFS